MGLARRSGDQAGDPVERHLEDLLVWAGCRPLNADHGFQFDDACGVLDEAQAQRVELKGVPGRAPGLGGAQALQQPVGSRVEEQAELVGIGFGAGCSVGSEVVFPGFDVVFGLATTAIDLIIEPARRALFEIGDDETCVSTLLTDLDAGDDAFDAAPASGAVVERFEAAHLALTGGCLEARSGAGFQIGDVAAQGSCRRHAQDKIVPARPAPIDHLGAAIVAVAAQQYLRSGPMAADRAQQTAQESPDFLAAGPFGRAQH